MKKKAGKAMKKDEMGIEVGRLFYIELPDKCHENVTTITILKELVVTVNNMHEKDIEMRIIKKEKN